MSGVGESETKGVEGPDRIGFGERRPAPEVRGCDPERVGEGTGRVESIIGNRHRLTRPSNGK